MKLDQVKQWACQFLLTVAGFLLLVLACATVQGLFFPPLAVLLGLGDLVAMNFLCGLCAPAPARTETKPVPLRVVRGGRAA